MIRYLLLDRDDYLKIGIVVEEYWPTWEIVLPSLMYTVLQIHAPSRFSDFLQVCTLSGSEWLPHNQAKRLIHLQYTNYILS